MGIPFKKSKKGITIKIKVYPKSAQSGISGIAGDVLKIKVNAPPVGGEANKELIEILSDTLRLKKTSIKIIKGHTSRNKIVEIECKERIEQSSSLKNVVTR
jgi:uncharacterized protein (TIGR00251 family)